MKRFFKKLGAQVQEAVDGVVGDTFGKGDVEIAASLTMFTVGGVVWSGGNLM